MLSLILWVFALNPTTAPAEPFVPPPYKPVRYLERYDYLADPDKRMDWSDELKFLKLGTDTGYSPGGPMSPRLFAKLNFISGDDDPDDSTLGTFNALFPRGSYFGEIGQIGPRNLINLQPGVMLRPTEKLAVYADVNFFWRFSTGDGVYDNPGRLVRSGAGSDARYIGTQFTAGSSYQVDRHLRLRVEASALTAGQFIQDTGSDETIFFFLAEARYLF